MATIKLTKEGAEQIAHFQNMIEADALAGFVRSAAARERLVNELVNSLSRQGDLMAFIQQPMSAMGTINAINTIPADLAAQLALPPDTLRAFLPHPTSAINAMHAISATQAGVQDLAAASAAISAQYDRATLQLGWPADLVRWPAGSPFAPAVIAPAEPSEQPKPEPLIKPTAPADLLSMLEQAIKTDKKMAKQALALIGKHAGADEAALRAELLELEEYERKWLKVKGRMTPEAFVKKEKGKSRAEHFRILKRLKEVRLLLSAMGSETK